MKRKPTYRSLPSIVQGYLLAALWTEDPSPGSGDYTETGIGHFPRITAASIAKAEADCARFAEENAADIEASELPESTVGHCLWLSRNGHGSGFFDRADHRDPDTVQDACGRLQDAARTMGEVYADFPERGPIRIL